MSVPAASRRVSRFRPCPPTDDPVYSAVPDDGLCLNVFLLLTDRAESNRILLGRIDPKANWKEIGAMSAARIQEVSTRWMLPSRQLFHFESPDEASRSILAEQLGLGPISLRGPSVTSEAWQRPHPAGNGPHWDVSFLYQGIWPKDHPVSSGPWSELAFLATDSLDPATVGRSHLDVLDLAGYPTRRG